VSLLWLTRAVLIRALREGMLVRALAWPGLLTAATLVLSASAAGLWWNSDRLVVEDPELVAVFEGEGIAVDLVDDAEAEVLAGDAERGIWNEGDTRVLGTAWGGRMQNRIEGALRDHDGAAWTIRTPPAQGRARALGPATRALVGLMGVLFTLYGVVFGAGALHRDRADGLLDAEGALPVPHWMHRAARLLAACLLLFAGMLLTVGLLHSLIGLDRPWSWVYTGSIASAGSVALGLGLMARAGQQEALSGPLTRGMALASGLLGLGWALPELGRHLPISGIGALARNQDPSLVPLLVLALLVLVACRIPSTDR
jgi:hypothetical protein